MNDDFSLPTSFSAAGPAETPTLGMSSLFRLFEAFIAMREKNERYHKMFEQSLNRTRDGIQNHFNTFVQETQKAYQQLRQELHADKRLSLQFLNELLEIGQDLERIVAARPKFSADSEEGQALARWMDAIEVEHRKVQAALERHGVHTYDAVIGSAYNPALHERVGSCRTEGLGPYLVAQQREPGYASMQPEFVLRRPKVIVSE